MNAVDRKAAVAAQDTKTGVKRQRTNGSDYENNVVPEFVHPGEFVPSRIVVDNSHIDTLHRGGPPHQARCHL